MSQKKILDNVTLIAVSDVKIPETLQSLIRCLQLMDFACAKFITSKEVENIPNNIIIEKPSFELNSGDKYNEYAFLELEKHVDTSHCLLVQHDSGIIHPELWNDEWLEYSYIGAPWPIKDDAYICHATGEHIRNGNGGFSLRGKDLLGTPKKLGLPLKQEQGYANEDGNINCYSRVELLEAGIKYAPLEVAIHFSHELDIPENQGIQTFGYHKYLPFQKTIFNSVMYL